MELIRTSILTGLSTGIKLASAFVINKVVAVVAGPAGMAVIGQLQGIVGIALGMSAGSLGTPAVTAAAKASAEPGERTNRLSLIFTLSVLVSFLAAGALFLSGWPLARSILGDPRRAWLLWLLALLMPLAALNTIFISVVNGSGRIRDLTIYNIAQSALALLLTVGLCLTWGLSGALLATVVAPVVVAVLTLRPALQEPWLRLRVISWQKDRQQLKESSGYVVMAVVAAVGLPFGQLLVRDHLIQYASLEQAGYWQALQRLSTAYTGVFTAVMATYFLPKFAGASFDSVKHELSKGLLLFVPFSAVSFGVVYALRTQVFEWMFSAQFVPAAEYLPWMLLSDFIRIPAWLFGFLVVAKGKVLSFTLIDVGSTALYTLLACSLIRSYPGSAAKSAVVAQAVNYALYLPVVMVVGWRAAREAGPTPAQSTPAH